MTKVLVADDDPSIRRIVARLLEREGYQVTVCEDGVAALNALQAAPPDLLLTDLHMPGMTGFELLSIVRIMPQPPKIILFSGDASADLLEAGKLLGAITTIQKPFTAAELLTAIRQAQG